MNQAEIDELVSAGIAKDQEDIDELVGMLKATLWVLEHPEVNALNFCGSPRLLALKARNILSKHAEKARRAELPMVEPVHSEDGVNGAGKEEYGNAEIDAWNVDAGAP